MKSCQEWLSYIEQLHHKKMDLTLDRVSAVVQQMSLNRFNCPVITIGGTNGKGSTVALLKSIYEAQGYRVAAYTSPHLLSFNERIYLDGRNIADEDLCAAFEVIDRSRGEISLSYFEFSTIAALYYFKQEEPDVILLEVGLGGRLDAVNAVDSDVAVVTTISMDHMRYLGNTRDAIAYEKAGIFRKNKYAICGDPKAPLSLVSHAEAIHSKLLIQNRDFEFTPLSESWSWSGVGDQYSGLKIPKLKLQNASTALQILTVLQDQLPVNEAAINRGLEKAWVPGRFQKLSQDPNIIVDVAHNPESMEYLVQQIKQLSCSGKFYCLIGMLADKNIDKSIEPLIAVIDEWYTVTLNTERTAGADDLKAILLSQNVTSVIACETTEKTLKSLRTKATENDTIIVCGSFHTVSEAIEAARVSESETMELI